MNSETKSNNIHGVFLHTSSCYFSILKGGMVPDNVSDNSPWACLTERLAHISLMPYDVGGSGDCFFKSVSHQLYGTPDLHFQIRILMLFFVKFFRSTFFFIKCCSSM